MKAAPLVLAFLLLAPASQAFTIEASAPSIESETGNTQAVVTTVKNEGEAATGRLVISMNIVNLKDDRVVDPEDWSPQRSQFIETLEPGESLDLEWTLFTILGGEYAVYFVVIEEPTGATESGDTAVSKAVHLTVHEKPQYNPGGILPFTIGVPLLVGAVGFGLRFLRRRGLDQA